MITKTIVTQETTTVNTTTSFSAIQLLHTREFGLQINLSNNSSANMQFDLLVSNDNVVYQTLPGFSLTINTNTSHFLDVDCKAHYYVQGKFTWTAGSIDAALIYSIAEDK